jgi:hypothetical protein
VNAVPDHAPTAPPPIRVEPATAVGFPRAFGNGYHFLVAMLTALGFLGGVLLLWVFGYTFWVALEGMTRAFGWPHGESLLLTFLNRVAPLFTALFSGRGWPLDAAVLLGFLAMWASLYLYFDRLAMFRNRAAHQILMRKVKTRGGELTRIFFFVEVRRTTSELPLPPDTGWLLFYADRLMFVGDEYRATIPREQVQGTPAILRSPGGLTASWVEIELAEPYGRLRFLPRQYAARLSDTAENVGPLYESLSGWLSETQPAASADR